MADIVMLVVSGFLVARPTANGFVIAVDGADAAAARGAARGRGRVPFTVGVGGALDIRITLRRHRDFFAAALGAAAIGARIRATIRVRGWNFHEPGFGSTSGVAFDLTAVEINGAAPESAPASAPASELTSELASAPASEPASELASAPNSDAWPDDMPDQLDRIRFG